MRLTCIDLLMGLTTRPINWVTDATGLDLATLNSLPPHLSCRTRHTPGAKLLSMVLIVCGFFSGA